MSRQLVLVIEEIPDNSSLLDSSQTVVDWAKQLEAVMESMPIGRLQIQGAKSQTR